MHAECGGEVKSSFLYSPETLHLYQLIYYCTSLKRLWRRCSEILSNTLHLHTAKPKVPPTEKRDRRTSMVGSYSSTKWFWMSWMVSALLPTPPAPTTTSLYSVMFVAAAHQTLARFLQRKQRGERCRCIRRASLVDAAFIHYQRLESDENLWDHMCY